jgi:dihydroorotase
MKILVRQARIVDPSSPYHQQQLDIFINNGIIESVGSSLDVNADREIQLDDLHVSTGWVDIFSHFNDPGSEQKETLETGAAAAASGGYTQVFLVPNTSPCIHNKAGVEYIIQRSKSFASELLPIAAVTKNTEGKELAEMYDMHASGAIAFSDGINSIQSSGITMKALQYLKAINGVLIQVPNDKSVGATGLMHEGIVSTRLGLPGQPAIAEKLMIRRDIELVKYTGSAIHFTGISSKESVELIKNAKAEGLPVTCSVTPNHLCFVDEDVQGYDTNLKLTPPLRTAEDREALRNGVLDGTIDCIASHHFPQDFDNKVVEFEYAKPGMIGLQTAFAVVKTCLPQITNERLIELFSTNPRKLFGLETNIAEGAIASLSLFQPNRQWTFEEENILSKSKNSAFIGKGLTGKPLGIIHKDKLFLNAYE